MKRIIIAGSRGFNDYKKLSEECDRIIDNLEENFEIVSGTAKGADRMGEYYASERGYSIKRFPAQWEKYGKSAGYIRNSEMARYSDMLIAFWDGKSRGTSHMINLASEEKLEVEVIMI